MVARGVQTRLMNSCGWDLHITSKWSASWICQARRSASSGMMRSKSNFISWLTSACRSLQRWLLSNPVSTRSKFSHSVSLVPKPAKNWDIASIPCKLSNVVFMLFSFNNSVRASNEPGFKISSEALVPAKHCSKFGNFR